MWRFTKLDLIPGDFNLIIEGVAGDGSRGDIAIDDLSIIRGPCSQLTDQVFNMTVHMAWNFTMMVMKAEMEHNSGEMERSSEEMGQNSGEMAMGHMKPQFLGDWPGVGDHTWKDWVCSLSDGAMNSDMGGDRSNENMGGSMNDDNYRGSNSMGGGYGDMDKPKTPLEYQIHIQMLELEMLVSMKEETKMGGCGCNQSRGMEEEWKAGPECMNKDVTGEAV